MTTAKLDLNDAALFAKVVEKGSFTGAARQLGLPVSSVSRKVARLEEQLGSRLLHRTTRKLSLTDAGRTYHSMVSAGLEQLDAAAAAVTDLQDELRGRIRFTAVAGLGRYAWDLIEDFLRAHPKVSIEMDLTERTVDLIAGGYDLALRAGTLPDSSLISRRLMENSFGLYATPAYLEDRGVPETPDDLELHDCLIHGLAIDGASWRLTRGRTERTVPVGGRLASTNLEALLRGRVAGLGIAHLPSDMCEVFVEQGVFVRVIPQWSGPVHGLWLVYPSRHHLAPSVRAFIDRLSESLSDNVISGDLIYKWITM